MSVESSLDHIWHVWINRRQDGAKKDNPSHKHEHSLYEFRSMLQFLTYGRKQIQDAFEGKLPTTHKQCSHSPTIPIINNVLKCSLGKEVVTCPILLQLKATFDEKIASVYPLNGEKAYPDVPPETVYGLMAKTCAWHIYGKSCNVTENWGGVDTSMGYLMDTSDRMFWDRVHENMSMTDPDDEHPSPCPTGVEA